MVYVAIMAAILQKDKPRRMKNWQVVDISSLSLGIETKPGIKRRHIIKRNTVIPTSYKTTLRTAADNQTVMPIKVYQGEPPWSENDVLIRRFKLDGIPPAPRGEVKIGVSFNVDINGFVNLSVVGPQNDIIFTDSTGSFATIYHFTNY